MKRGSGQRFFAGWLQVAPVVSSSCAGSGFLAGINSYGELKGKNTRLFGELELLRNIFVYCLFFR